MNKTPAVLALSHVTKIFGKGDAAFTAVHDATLSIAKGESVAIVGKSGSGKSTLMHILALMDQPTSGSVTVAGADAAKLSGHELSVLRNHTFGFVFQQFFLNGNATVLENVILPLKIGGMGSRERRSRGMAVLRSVGLEDKAKSKAADLSGGQKQRAVIARALANQPTIIFADEPTGNLDSATGRMVADLLFDLHQSHGITLVLITHDEDLATRCGRRLSIVDGRLHTGIRSKTVI